MRDLLTNVVKHSKGLQADLSIRRIDHAVRIAVRDDGRWFDAARAGTTTEHGFGLFNTREKLKACGRSVGIDSTPGQGTTMMVNLPVGPGKVKSRQ